MNSEGFLVDILYIFTSECKQAVHVYYIKSP